MGSCANTSNGCIVQSLESRVLLSGITFAAPIDLSHVMTKGVNLFAADVNGDGNQDVVMDSGAIYLGNGHGGFNALLSRGTLGGNVVALGDFNGDGKVDAVHATGTAVTMQTGNGNASFNLPQSATLARSTTDQFFVTSFGSHDQLITWKTGESKIDILGIGRGGWQILREVTSAAPLRTVKTGDFNNDGKADLIYEDTSGHLHIMTGKGGFLFNADLLLPTGMDGQLLSVSDLNGDGVDDLYIGEVDTSGGGPFSTCKLTAFYGHGNLTFTQGGQTAMSWPAGNSCVVDANSDGTPDLIAWEGIDGYTLGARAGGANNVLDSAAASLGSWMLGGGPMAVTDFNNDGRVDILSRVQTASSGMNGVPYLFLNTSAAGAAVGPINGLAARISHMGALGLLTRAQRSTFVTELSTARSLLAMGSRRALAPAAAQLNAFIAGLRPLIVSGQLAMSVVQPLLDNATAIRRLYTGQ